jgi:hypothetical protein
MEPPALAQNRTGKRRVVIALRERGGRTLTRAFLREAEGVDFAKERIEPGAVVAADDVAHWNLLTPTFDTRRINHSDAYSRDVSANRLGAYAAHAAWLEDHRFESNGWIADQLIRNGLSCPVSRAWKGYWQGAGYGRPYAHAFAFLHHGHKLAPRGVPQSLNDLEDD